MNPRHEVESPRSMGRKPATNPKSVQLTFRVDAAIGSQLDAIAEAESRPGVPLNRSMVARMLIAEALETRAGGDRPKRAKK